MTALPITDYGFFWQTNFSKAVAFIPSLITTFSEPELLLQSSQVYSQINANVFPTSTEPIYNIGTLPSKPQS